MNRRRTARLASDVKPELMATAPESVCLLGAG
jgi:hypothetical protein